jgi:O-antigen/teichoic acid export membrane protein
MSDAVRTSPEAHAGVQRSADHFVRNVIWNWVGVAVQLLPGFVVTPYMIYRLGTEQYGIWSLVFSLVGYYALVDLGFRSAAVRYAAHFHALGQADKINELVNTLLLYFSTVAAALAVFTALIWRRADQYFQVSPRHHDVFAWLVLLAGLNLSVGVIGSVFSGCVEGFHRFDVSNRIFIVSFGARSVGWFALLAAGKGLISLAALALVTNSALVIMYAWAFGRVFPSLSVSPRHATMRMFRLTAAYGLQTFLAGIATRGMEQITPVLIGHYRSMAEVGYYNFPLRLLQYGTDAVSRVGIVVTPKSADMDARQEFDRIGKLAVFSGRYCLVLFMPITLFLGMYGRQLFTVWLRKPELAAASGPLLPVMLVGFTLAQAAQFCSASILFGLGAQRGYALALTAELAANVAGTIMVLPRYGIMGAALVTSVLMLLVRGMVTPFLLCRRLQISFTQYMGGILFWPLATSVPLWVALSGLRRIGIDGHTARELIGIVVGAGTAYLTACYFTCVPPEHRMVLRGWVNYGFTRISKPKV